ncbi:MAG: cysteine synthase family protein [Holophagaceae bacterium]|uniref:Cysteine synthase family protein n=1 Tax=Candidatus Geothrix odensensis TaxID=2954440 RepID=A0A936F348_9BACT|nr:cysteine synthase family protein [Candidatus Geothrix odensensis]
MTKTLPPVVDSVLDLVGNTPLLRLTRFAPDFQIFSKLEYLNPGGSVKDRIGVGMIRSAEALGQIQPGVSTIIEPTAGNTGVGLAIAAKALGYRCILCVPTKYSREKMMLMKALGAELVLIPKEQGMKGAIEKCAELAASIPHAFVPQQFANPSNPDSHYATTGPEIWDPDGRPRGRRGAGRRQRRHLHGHRQVPEGEEPQDPGRGGAARGFDLLRSAPEGLGGRGRGQQLPPRQPRPQPRRPHPRRGRCG